MHPIIHTILQYFFWVICWVLGLFLLIVFRTAYFLMLAPLSESGFQGNAWAITFDKVFIIGAGIAFLAFIIFAEAYLRKGRQQNLLLGRFSRLLGTEFLILFILHASIAVNTGFSAAVIALLGTELIVGMTALGFSFQVLPPGSGKFSQRIHQFFRKW
jgi:hypothetical protein